ncbi:MAG TPA: hypothetical protein VKD00_00570 [Methyloceanibacter sp.]|nr:hypothetical protein [Methyloceanibacter sp.]
MRAKGVFRNLRRGNYAKVVAALTPGSHQLVAPNRYPEIFAAAAAAAPNARRILSFGCSTGEGLEEAKRPNSFRLFQRPHFDQAGPVRRGVLHGGASRPEKATAPRQLSLHAILGARAVSRVAGSARGLIRHRVEIKSTPRHRADLNSGKISHDRTIAQNQPQNAY